MYIRHFFATKETYIKSYNILDWHTCFDGVNVGIVTHMKENIFIT